MILALSRKLYKSIKRTHEELRFETDVSLRGFDLQKKTIGIIGGGSIGLHVARMAKGFEMNVLVFDLNKNQKIAKEIGFKYTTLKTLISKSDIITMHVPYNSHTHHLIDKDSISNMKQGVYLINTARGGIIETDSLYKGLKSGKIAGAALDVLENECNVLEESSVLSEEFKKICDLKTILEDHKLMMMDNVIVTPHNAFNSIEALNRILDTTILNVKSYKNKKLINCVTK